MARDTADDATNAKGIELPAVGMDVNSDLPPAGESYHHDEFRAGMEYCPIDGCDGPLNRTKVVADSGKGDEPVKNIDTLEVTCRSCQRVLYKSEQIAYDGLERD